LIGAFSCGPLFAHQETIIRLEGKTLVGLPSKYSPAELDLEALRLRIGGHVMEFSPLLRSFFKRQPYDLAVSASWYHDGPPYLVLEVTPKGRDYSYGIVLPLDTLLSPDIYVKLRGTLGPPETFTMQTLQIALSDFDKKQIAELVKDVR
jgi:hypothetical protein